ncbi:MAG: hypothetical protein WCJ37_16360 [Syntrophus sp. (in: bacteria)]
MKKMKCRIEAWLLSYSKTTQSKRDVLARQISRSPFFQKRMQYLDQEAKVVCVSKDGK